MEISNILDAGGILRRLEAKQNDDPNQFAKDLAASNAPEVTAWWNRVHTQAFNNVIAVDACEDIHTQKSGIDRYVTVQDGEGTRVVSIEEKLDGTDFKNIAFEVWSTKGRTPGWSFKPCAAQIFCYAFKNRNTIHYFSTQELLQVWSDNATEWQRKYGEFDVRTSHAVICPVPVKLLIEVCNFSHTIVLEH